jgi:hypothetical protein
MIVTGSPAQSAHRDLITSLAAKHRLPAIYNARFFAVAGGLISYGADFNTNHDAQRLTSTAFSRAKSQSICPYRRRPSTSW